jgi:hypothetical protein
MDVELDVLGALVVDWVAEHVHRGDVVAEHHYRLVNLAAELTEEVLQP